MIIPLYLYRSLLLSHVRKKKHFLILQILENMKLMRVTRTKTHMKLETVHFFLQCSIDTLALI